MKVYVFSSNSFENVRIGEREKIWAINRPGKSLPIVLSKASKVRVGDFGLLYCKNPIKKFVLPFRFLSVPDFHREVTDIWDGCYILPFEIQPLAMSDRMLDVSFLKRNLPSIAKKAERWDDIMCIKAVQAFTPAAINEADWDALLAGFGLVSHPLAGRTYPQGPW